MTFERIKFMTHQTTQKAIIYCRSACISVAQKDGDSINSQLIRNREFVSHKGYEVCAVFKDEGVSGNVIDRPGLQSMLKFLRAHRKDNLTIIIDNPARLARKIEAFISLRTEIANVGALIETYSGENSAA